MTMTDYGSMPKSTALFAQSGAEKSDCLALWPKDPVNHRKEDGITL